MNGVTSPPGRLSGVFAPVLTPFGADLAPDPDRLLRHCRWLASQGAGLALFGTTSEANSLAIQEKIELLHGLAEAGVDLRRVLAGTGACAVTDAVTLTREAVRLGCPGVLMLPPFYYKGVSEEGLFRYYSAVIEGVASRDLRIYLYHIPPVSQVGIPIRLIGRLIEAWPETIAGIKDSSGHWEHTRALHAEAWDGFRIFAGSETFLLRNMRSGGAGCISATANINPAGIDRLYRQWQSPDAARQQRALDDVRDLLHAHPMIPALKAVVAHFGDDAGWQAVRPPLVPLSADQRSLLIGDLEASGFTMPGLPVRSASPLPSRTSSTTPGTPR